MTYHRAGMRLSPPMPSYLVEHRDYDCVKINYGLPFFGISDKNKLPKLLNFCFCLIFIFNKQVVNFSLTDVKRCLSFRCHKQA